MGIERKKEQNTETISGIRKIKCGILNGLMYVAAGLICVLLAGMIGYILYRGVPYLSLEF